MGNKDYENLKDSQPYFKELIFENAYQVYLELLGNFQYYLDTHPLPVQAIRLDTTNLHIEQSDHAHALNDAERLPRINLSDFDGNYRNWESFRDIFTNLVVNKTNVSNATKLRHLRSCLKGEAFELVQSYNITDDNFEIVWGRLKDKYENKKRLVNAHIAAIYSLKPMSRACSSDLKRILNGINTPLSALKILNRPVDKWDDLLIYFISSLFDSETKKEWEIFLGNLQRLNLGGTIAQNASQQNASSTPNNNSNHTTTGFNCEPPTFANLICFIYNQISILETLEESSSISLNQNNKVQNLCSENSNSGKFKNFNLSTQPAKVLHTQVENNLNTKINKNSCILCKNNHYFVHCPEFKRKTPEQKKEFIKTEKRCFNCFGKHFIDKCTSEKRCNTCQKKHHSSLHLNNLIKKNDAQEKSSNIANAQLNSDELNSSESTSSLTNHNCDISTQVLLSTAIIRISDTNNHVYFVRALVDQG